jgi:hypothetical protein
LEESCRLGKEVFPRSRPDSYNVIMEGLERTGGGVVCIVDATARAVPRTDG